MTTTTRSTLSAAERRRLKAAALEALGGDLAPWAGQCHAAAIAVVKSGALGVPCRVARGGAYGVGGQHSWVVLGMDCYDPATPVLDPTLWSYVPAVGGIYVGSRRKHGHLPHGSGSIWTWGRPAEPTGPIVELRPRRPWSARAERFLDMLGPLDRRGWMTLANAPVEDWPAGEILDAMEHSGLGALIPIDHLGMATDLNPGGLYLPGESSPEARDD